MDKKEAAAILGVSEKTISRYVSSGRLAHRFVRGKTGKMLDFEVADVERLKEELESPIQSVAEVVEDTQDNEGQDNAGQGMTSDVSTLVPTSFHAQGNNFFEQLAVFLAERDKVGQASLSQVVPISEKLNLTVKEAGLYTGRSEKDIRDAIKAGDLEQVKMARGAVGVKRSQLEKWNG